ncbi:MAG: ABC transporter ATP-binding protein [Actinomycetota bacterium]|nr:ABC transporter ATP-binding protein [Actinomycetota bacterium]
MSGSEPAAAPVQVGAAPQLPPAVRVQDLSVVYRTPLDKQPTLQQTLKRLGRRQRVVREVRAVTDVSFQVPRGSVLGIIGANGAGKSTLVRSVAGILPPTAGRIEVRGRVSTLLALGVGFNARLTGRQNVMLGGLAAGLTRDALEQRYEEIAEFAELGEFMDMPMNTYSSGMYSRLGFSVAVTMRPDVLLVDEALSTGDARFRRKSFDKMSELVADAGTIVLVSHALASIKQLCDSVLWMHQGRLLLHGPPEDVVAAYTRFLDVGETPTSLEDV